MIRSASIRWLCIFTLLLAGMAFGQSYKVEPAGAPPADLPQGLKDLLQSTGVKFEDSSGTVLAQIWTRKDYPLLKGVGPTADVLYGALGNGVLVGGINFPKDTQDYRQQNIKAGSYTLRHQLIPTDGNHMGVNPYRDALLMCPVASDTGYTATLDFADLVKLSTKASGTPHPGFLIMAPVKDPATSPLAFQDDQQHWDVQTDVQGADAKLPIAVTLVGHFEG
jgi:hypothetical protein